MGTLVEGGMLGMAEAETAAFNALSHSAGMAFESGVLTGYAADQAEILLT